MKDPDALELLFVGDVDIDARIQGAYTLGFKRGQKTVNPDALIVQRVKMANRIIRSFGCTPLEALIVMEVPKAERKPVLKTLETHAKQKSHKNKPNGA